MTKLTARSESEVGGIAVATVVFLVGMMLLGSLIYGWSKPMENPETNSFASRVLKREVGLSAAHASSGGSAHVADEEEVSEAGASEAPQAEAESAPVEEESWD